MILWLLIMVDFGGKQGVLITMVDFWGLTRGNCKRPLIVHCVRELFHCLKEIVLKKSINYSQLLIVILKLRFL